MNYYSENFKMYGYEVAIIAAIVAIVLFAVVFMMELDTIKKIRKITSSKTRSKLTISGLIIVFAILPAIANGQRLNHESFYQQSWCDQHGGETEVIQPDRTRVDCITYAHAIEFDFADKWAEALGQALHYGRLTGLRAGIVLIVEDPGDLRYVDRLRENIEHYSLPVDLFTTRQ